MNIAQITFYNTMNYGGTLQAYALNRILSEYAHCECINYLPANKKHKGLKAFARSFLYRKRKKAFDIFVLNYINVSKPYENLEDVASAYDCFVCGSDQIWNMHMISEDCRDFYFLHFGNSAIKRISYAASIGQNRIEDRYVSFVKDSLSGFAFISLREKTCVQQIAEITGKPVSVAIDPTFLLTRDQWDDIAFEVGSLSPYLLVYDLSAKKEFTDAVNKLSKILKLPVVHFRHKGIYQNELKSFFNYGPREFLTLIKNARFVFSSSFHGTVFSIIFEKDFYVWNSGSTNSRIESLLSTIGLEDRLLSKAEFKFDSQIEWKTVKEKLAVIVNESMSFLKNSLA